MNKNALWISIVLLSLLALVGCAQPTPSEPTPDLARQATEVEATVVAELTRRAVNLDPSATAPPPTATLPPTDEPTATPEIIEPSPTPLPTLEPTATPVPVTSTPVSPCEKAEFVQHVSVLPQSSFEPGTDFTKIWRIRNTGACTWNHNYDLAFDAGDRMGGPSSVSLNREVRPGESIDLAVDFRAPSSVGNYRGEWLLINPSGDAFGTGANAQNPFVVEITVSEFTRVALDFVEDVCEARWRNDDGGVPCPGSDGDAEGFVFVSDNPALEDGSIKSEPAIVMHPRVITDGLLRGRYPSYTIRPGDHFRAVIGCLDGHPNCNVRMEFRYRPPGEDAITIQEWNEKFNQRVTHIDIDLTHLAGLKVEFVLLVRAKGSPDGDYAFWLSPRIVR